MHDGTELPPSVGRALSSSSGSESEERSGLEGGRDSLGRGYGGGSDSRGDGRSAYRDRRSPGRRDGAGFPPRPYPSRFPGFGGGKGGFSSPSGHRARRVVVERRIRRPFGATASEAGSIDAEIHSLESTIIENDRHSISTSNELTHGERQARLEALELHKRDMQRRRLQLQEQESARREQQEKEEPQVARETEGEGHEEAPSSGSTEASSDFGALSGRAEEVIRDQDAPSEAADVAGHVRGDMPGMPRRASPPHEASLPPSATRHDSSPHRRTKRREGPSPERRGAQEYRRRPYGRVHIERMLVGEDDRQRSLASVRRRIERERRKHTPVGEHRMQARSKAVREVNIPDAITIQDLANRMSERAVDLIRRLMGQGVMLKVTDVVDAEMAQLIVEEFGHVAKHVSDNLVEEGLVSEDDPEETKVQRPPVVAVMGHVDHGKTSLLDALRQTDVVAGESGGITQHIGAYQVTLGSGRKITFLDTPGHEAFTAIRARGSRVADIVILVVAADDGVMPQTVEAIQHARSAEVPIVVAVNKMDKAGADVEKVKEDLLRHGIVVEGYGGDVLMVPVSVKKREGLVELEEAVLLQAELLDLRARVDRPAEGVVIESRLDKGLGPSGTVLVRRGTLRTGDIVLSGVSFGRVRSLLTDRRQSVKEVGPSTPVVLVGLSAVPDVGDSFVVVENEARAREVSDYRMRLKTKKRLPVRASVDQAMKSLSGASGPKALPVIIKADVKGSVEAISQALEKVASDNSDRVSIRVVHADVGAVTDSDVHLASVSGAPIIAFNVRPTGKSKDLAKQQGVDIYSYSVVYHLVDGVKSLLSGLLPPKIKETSLGMAEILDVFVISKVGKVAGCLVKEGTIVRHAAARVVRDGAVLYEGKIGTLRRFKEDVKAVKEGLECGLSIETYQGLMKGDLIECFQTEELEQVIQ